jgi:hypothetical protein
MLKGMFLAVVVVVSNIAIHTSGAIYLVRRWQQSAHLRRHASARQAFWSFALFFLCIMTLHVLEMASWAEFYLWNGCFSDRETSYYFSLMTYTTVGYGDVVLGRPWRLIGGLEAMTGVLLFGWSTAMLLAMIEAHREILRNSKE